MTTTQPEITQAQESLRNAIISQMATSRGGRAADAIMAKVEEYRTTSAAPLVEAVEKARDTFRRYAEMHFAKGSADGDEKGSVNSALALQMEYALAQFRGEVG